MTNEDDFTGLIARLRASDRAAWQELWDRYGAQLERVIRNRLTANVRQREGADDVLISVFRTFWRRMSAGQFQLAEDEDLVKLLFMIAVNKARMKQRYHLQEARSVAREEAAGSGAPGAEDRFGRVADPTSLPVAVAVAEQLEALFTSLSAEELPMVTLWLDGLTRKEIAEQLNRSVRYVHERLRRVKRRLARDLEDTTS